LGDLAKKAPPLVVLLLHVWCQGHFFATDDLDETLEVIVRVGNLCFDNLERKVTLKWMRLLYATVSAIMSALSKCVSKAAGDDQLQPLHPIVNDFLGKCERLDNNSSALCSRINSTAQEIVIMCSSSSCLPTNDSAVIDVDDDFLSFLDPLIIDSLTNGGASADDMLYQPAKARSLREKCAAACPSAVLGQELQVKSPLRFTPYNILEDTKRSSKEGGGGGGVKSFSSGGRSTSSAAAAAAATNAEATAEVWTLEGRLKSQSANTPTSVDCSSGGVAAARAASSPTIAQDAGSPCQLLTMDQVAMNELQDWRE